LGLTFFSRGLLGSAISASKFDLSAGGLLIGIDGGGGGGGPPPIIGGGGGGGGGPGMIC